MLKMIAIGNLTGDPVLKTNEETGKPYAIMRIASDRRYKSPDQVAGDRAAAVCLAVFRHLPRIAATNLRMEKS